MPPTVPPALRPIVLLARMRALLPPTELTDLLATLTPPIDPADAAWTDLCAALDTYDHAADQGLNLDEARYQVDIAAMILDAQHDSRRPAVTQRMEPRHVHRTAPPRSPGPGRRGAGT
ncbi:hypothetical protein Franean1_2631 [Parafrankia sp. EAN1pec]|uniref:hypothetical protein n=1 Tax=Parafrankia sp. (strain EAN1pec) TaxID=298653 RepID=UPI00015D9E32|nr:hypothetical protein Franean1_2631 [Frankia sp. EAN1pec]